MIARGMSKMQEMRDSFARNEKGATEAAPLKETEQIYLPEVEEAEVAG